jgi:hypothetical protein
MQTSGNVETAPSSPPADPKADNSPTVFLGLMILAAIAIAGLSIVSSQRAGETQSVVESGLNTDQQAELESLIVSRMREVLNAEQSDYIATRGQELAARLTSIDPADTLAIELLKADVAELEAYTKRLAKSANRKIGEPGFPLEDRRKAVIEILVGNGLRRELAVQTANDMVKYGSLPDPPSE